MNGGKEDTPFDINQLRSTLCFFYSQWTGKLRTQGEQMQPRTRLRVIEAIEMYFFCLPKTCVTCNKVVTFNPPSGFKA